MPKEYKTHNMGEGIGFGFDVERSDCVYNEITISDNHYNMYLPVVISLTDERDWDEENIIKIEEPPNDSYKKMIKLHVPKVMFTEDSILGVSNSPEDLGEEIDFDMSKAFTSVELSVETPEAPNLIYCNVQNNAPPLKALKHTHKIQVLKHKSHAGKCYQRDLFVEFEHFYYYRDNVYLKNISKKSKVSITETSEEEVPAGFTRILDMSLYSEFSFFVSHKKYTQKGLSLSVNHETQSVNVNIYD